MLIFGGCIFHYLQGFHAFQKPLHRFTGWIYCSLQSLPGYLWQARRWPVAMMLLKTFQRLRLEPCAVAITWRKRDLQKIVSEIIACKYKCSKKQKDSPSWYFIDIYRVDFVEEILCESSWDSWLVCYSLQVSRCWFCYNVSCPPSTAKRASNISCQISIFQNPKGKEPSHLGFAHIFCCLL